MELLYDCLGIIITTTAPALLYFFKLKSSHLKSDLKLNSKDAELKKIGSFDILYLE